MDTPLHQQGERKSRATRQFAPLGLNINNLSERAALGYPESFVGHDQLVAAEILRSIRHLPAADLARLVEAVDEPLDVRLAAGALLALIGDPRIDPGDPTMVTVPAGRWEIGLPSSDLAAVCQELSHLHVRPEWIEKETPRHQVQLAAFRISKYPVTNLEYKLFMEDSGWPEIPSSWILGRYPVERSNHPVHSVTPAAAEAYAEWLGNRTGRSLRLPSEAEWEIAAGGGRNLYPWGQEFDRARCNTVELGLLTTTPVGCFPMGNSPFGASDMAGNVEEIVADDYVPYPGGTPIPDDLAQKGSYRVTRGGCFSRFYDLARCRRRHGWIDKPIYALGMRLAEDVACSS